MGLALTSEADIIYSNIKLIGDKRYRELKLSDLLKENLESDNYNVFLVDEIQSLANSRSAMSKINQLFSFSSTQRRKVKAILIYTLTDFFQLDVNLRTSTDLLIDAYRFEEHFEYSVENRHTGKITNKKISREAYQVIFDSFETLEKVKSKKVDEFVREAEFESNYDEIIEKAINLVIEYCKSEKIKVTRPTIDLILMRNKIFRDNHCINDVYVRCKEIERHESNQSKK